MTAAAQSQVSELSAVAAFLFFFCRYLEVAIGRGAGCMTASLPTNAANDDDDTMTRKK